MAYSKELAFALAFVGGVTSAATLAQSQSTGDGSSAANLEEVIVTAQKREQALTDVGTAISVLNAEALESTLGDPKELAKLVPGLSIAVGVSGSPIFTLRGVGYNDASLTATPTVAVYLDEVPYPFPATTQGAMLDLSRVEVSKGPQGTLFGMNSTGGAINFIANKPTEAFEAGASATYGRFNYIAVDGFLSGPLTKTLKARFAVHHDEGDGWQESRTRPGEMWGAPDHSAARLLLDWDPLDSLSVNLNLNGWIDKTEPQMNQLIGIQFWVPAGASAEFAQAPITPLNPQSADWDANPQPLFPGMGGAFFRDNRFWQGALRVDLSLTDSLTLTSISSYSDFDRNQFADTDGSAVNIGRTGLKGTIESFNQELRLAGDTERLHWIVGLNYSTDDTADYNNIETVGYSNSRNLFGYSWEFMPNYTVHDITTKAIFANVDFAFTDRFSLVAGIRYTETDHKSVGCTQDPGPPFSPPAPGFALLSQALFPGNPYASLFTSPGCITIGPEGAPFERPDPLNESNTAWNISGNFKPTPESLLYLRVAKGYKAGSFPNAGAANYVSYLPAVQESVLAYEIGYRAPLFGRSLVIDTSVYYYDYSDKQFAGFLRDVVFGNLGATVNIPKSQVTGAELALRWTPLDGLSIGTSVAYIDTEIKEYTGYNNLGNLQDFAGAEFNYSPNWSINGDVSYVGQLTQTLNWKIGASAAYRASTDSTMTSLDPRTKLPKYTLVDAQLGILDAAERWSAMLWGRNITNEYYWIQSGRSVDGSSRFTGMPVTTGVTFTYNFR